MWLGRNPTFGLTWGDLRGGVGCLMKHGLGEYLVRVGAWRVGGEEG